jgi:threonine synthase
MFKDVETKGGFDLSEDPAYKTIAKYGFVSGKSTHANRLDTIRDIHAKYSVVIDTHTADGVKVARENLQENIPMLVLETALPIKFADTIKEALGRSPDCPAAFIGVEDLPQRVVEIPVDVNQVKAFVAKHTGL